jgi:ribosome-associated protein
MHRLENLRTLLLEDEKFLHSIAETYPGADLQQLRVLRRNAIKEKRAEQAAAPTASCSGASGEIERRSRRTTNLEGEGEE